MVEVHSISDPCKDALRRKRCHAISHAYIGTKVTRCSDRLNMAPARRLRIQLLDQARTRLFALVP